MSRNGSGTYQLPSGNPVVPSTVISTTWANNTLSDIGTALTQSIANDGQTVPVANLPMGAFRHTNVANAQNRNEYAAAGQIQDGGLTALSSISGTDTITANSAPAITVYTAGQCFDFIAAGANTTSAVTLNINGLGAKNITKLGGNGLIPSEIANGSIVRVRYDGAQFQVISMLMPLPALRNKILNGNFSVTQQNGASAITPSATAANVYPVDQWAHFSSQASKLTYQQVAAPAGFIDVAFAMKISTASAFSAAAADYFNFRQPIEGLAVQDFQFGASNAKPITLQIQVSATNTGLYALYFQNYAGTRSYVTTINVTAANTPQSFSVTVPGDTGGTWGAAGNNGFIYVGIDLGSGSNFNTTAGAWAAGNLTRTSGCVSMVANGAASITISGIQLETGTVATPREQRQPSYELLLCQRYAEYPAFGSTFIMNADTAGRGNPPLFWFYKTTKRTIPIVSISNGGGVNVTVGAVSASVDAFVQASTAPAAGFSSYTYTINSILAQM
jgi:hypothetical protein